MTNSPAQIPISHILLASQSKARYHMLRAAGLKMTVQDPLIDEPALQAKLKDAITPPDMMANALAQAKALSVAHRNPNDLVIGGDQILYCGGRIYSKATSAAEARQNLESLSGKQHILVSAVCVAVKDRVVWHHVDRAKVTMRSFDPATLDAYCAHAGDALLDTVGGYELEGLGMWLLDRVEGDHFTILGMPLLPLLHFLRSKGYGP